MAGPRVYAKMASDGYLPRCLAMGIGPPRLAIALQAGAAMAMLWSGSFEWFLSYIGFTLGVSTAVTVLGLMRLRLREGPSLLVFGWPWVPSLFLLGVVIITVLSMIAKPGATSTGVCTMAVGWLAWKIQNHWRSSSFMERGGIWVISQSALMLAVIAVAVCYHRDEVPMAWRLFGSLGILLGAFFGIAGVVALKGNRTIFPKPCEGSRLVQHGIYAYVRHPLYTSVSLLGMGWALLWGSGLAFSLAVAMLPFFYAKARVEEHWLKLKFPQYRDYEQKVRRFLPWVF